MAAWLCPHCLKSFFSAFEHPHEKVIKCEFCKREMDNPHYVKSANIQDLRAILDMAEGTRRDLSMACFRLKMVRTMNTDPAVEAYSKMLDKHYACILSVTESCLRRLYDLIRTNVSPENKTTQKGDA
ncbi:MAG: hypothetical protein AB1510_02235 [Bacillota bacterium]